MKRFIFFLIVVFCVKNVFAQNYENLVDTSKTWSTIFIPDIPIEQPWTEFVRFSNDTVFDGKIYREVQYSVDSFQYTWMPSGYIREVDKKVYYKNGNQNDTVTYVLYDFSRQVGEITDSLWCGYSMAVNYVDTVYFASKYRKRFHLYYYDPGDTTIITNDTTMYCEEWIEGVGSMNGIMRSGTYLYCGVTSTILCYFENSVLLHHNSNYSGFYYSQYGEIVSVSHKIISIFPNPTTDQIQIQGIQNPNYCLLSITGMVLIRGQGNKINISSLPSGVYFLRINNNPGMKKIIKI